MLFTPEASLPDGVGFSLFGSEHLALLLFFFVLDFILVRRLYFPAFFKILVIIMVLMELAKDLLLWQIGSFSVGYLPLHLCSLSLLFCLFASRHPDSVFAARLLLYLCLPAALGALLFPDWTNFPFLHFQSIHSFLYHNALVLFSILFLRDHPPCPGLKAVAVSYCALLILAVPVGFLNYFLHTNYMFLSAPSEGSPLALLGFLPGIWGYRIILAVFILFFLLFWNLLWIPVYRKLNRSSATT